MENPISRVVRSRTEARGNYNRLGRWYDRVAGSSEERYRQLGIRALSLQAEERVLEIGFGTGNCLVEFAATVGPDGWVCGMDLSEAMCGIAQQRLATAGWVDWVGLSQADGVNIPFKNSSFDAVFMSFCLELFDTPDIPLVLQQCRRVLNPKGRLITVAMVKGSPTRLPEKLYEWFHARMPVLVDCRPIPARVLLQQSGFTIADVILESMWGLPVEIITAFIK